jgi:site-specific DNA-methyltransferase (adenine-specific)
MHPEHFLTEKQLEKLRQGKLRYMPGPTSVIDDQFSDEDAYEKIDEVIQEALMVGFVKKGEQTGHPSQKPVSVYERIIRMATVEGELVIDPMAGSGTTGAACVALGRKAILCDSDPSYISMMESRLGIKRLSLTF